MSEAKVDFKVAISAAEKWCHLYSVRKFGWKYLVLKTFFSDLISFYGGFLSCILFRQLNALFYNGVKIKNKPVYD